MPQIDGQLIVIGIGMAILALIISKPFRREPKTPGDPIPQWGYRLFQFLVFASVTFAMLKLGVPNSGIASALVGVAAAFIFSSLLGSVARSVKRSLHPAIGADAGQEPTGARIDHTGRGEIGR